TGSLVLRGRSPSSLMEAHDLLAQAPSAFAEQSVDSMASHEHGDEAGWTMPPMHAAVPMLSGMTRLVPQGTPFLPSVDPSALPEARPRQLVRLGNGGTLDLEAAPVRRTINGRSFVMYGFNGQVPGPLIQVQEGTTIFVNFTNYTELPTAIHWHGVRLDNRYDGVPGVTQDPVQPGESFRYEIFFRDAGIYWYHPHHREDIQQELGLMGNILVDHSVEEALPAVNREEVLILDDLLLDESGAVAFGEASANYALMGRFGNVFLVNGEPSYSLAVDRGEVVRFFLTNASNTRTFNVSFGNAPIKVVGSDLGKFESEVRVDSIVLAPAERYIVDVNFASTGTEEMVNWVQGINHRYGGFLEERTVIGRIEVGRMQVAEDFTGSFVELHRHEEVVADIDQYRGQFGRPTDYELTLTLETTDLARPIEEVMRFDGIYFNPVEWTGTMPMMNWLTTTEEVRWILRESSTGRENDDIDWRFRLGDLVKIRLHNDRFAFHAMQHPLHIHGQRFLVVAQDGLPNTNLVWKDTVLLPVGSVTDILLEISNPGRWMVHCHIAEHLESGMKFVFEVEE
ncbi:MAG: multicopper oxidase family protein, partial [Acidobacteriota bacterium]|nr:multicopper oxidase family protein [Acidobacteriota bacterium]